MSRDWEARAACADLPQDWFFPERGGNPWPAKRACRACPVRDECFALGMSLPIDWPGIYGGATGADRRRARRAIERGDEPPEMLTEPPVVVPRRPRRWTDPTPKPGAKHGTRWAYEGRGCRCDECVDAQRIKGVRKRMGTAS